MKNIKKLFFLVLLSAVSFTACETEPVDPVLNENNEEEPAEAVFTVEMDGETYTATNMAAVVANGAIAITGVRGTSGEAVGVIVAGTTEGTYNTAFQFYKPDNSGLQYINVDPANADISGSVKITEIDTENKTVSGTFSFTGYVAENPSEHEPIVFESGHFENVPYTGDINPAPVGDEYFKAKVDGTLVNFGFINYMPLMDTASLNGANAGQSIDIRISEGIAPGTYPIGDDMDGVIATLLDINAQDAFSSIAGTLTIISNNEEWIKGTFSFTGENMDDETMEITDGEFNIKK